jgi:lipoprotein-anchoring transpeptidase ErfK/SrfK
MIAWVAGFRRTMLAVAGVGMLLTAAPAAHAQGLFNFDWDGGNTVGGSGRESVRFPAKYKPGELVVSFADRRVYLVTSPGTALSYPVAVPDDKNRWSGVTTVSDKRENPSWTPTAHMRSVNPRLPMWVPGGHPMNPLGVRAMYLGSSEYRIHGTDAPWTIGTAVSHGCVRMYNKDVLDLYPRVHVGARVTVTWERFNGAAVAADETQAPVQKAKQRAPARHSAVTTAGDAGE